MITCKPTSEHTPQWKKIFASSYIGLKELNTLDSIKLNQHELEEINNLFPIQVNQHLLKKHNIDSPVLRQYLPNSLELIDPPGYSKNPVGDLEAMHQPGVIKKYANRVLLITNNTCPIHCRYCFRKDFPYPSNSPNTHQFDDALVFCEQDKTIREVILSGGDPLSLEDDLLEHLFKSLEAISHINTIRIHTKYPSIIPERITSKFISILEECTLNKVCVFHINHPEEINQNFCDAVLKIKSTHTMTLNQSVLLNGVNNHAETLINLSHKLFDAGVLPYYLHTLDQAKGTHHFKVSTEETRKIMQELQASLPGYLVPKLAQEIPGHASKSY